jgi:DnaJ-class molecular chaperone
LEDAYKTLGVARDASQEDIRSAYRKLAKQHHPDLNPGNAKAEERFKAIAAANGLLSDVAKRGRYDRGEIDSSGHEQATEPSYREYADAQPGRKYDRAGPRSGGWSHDDFNDMFGSIFNRERGSHPETATPGEDERYALTTSFLDAVNGSTQRLTLPDGRTLEVKIPPGTMSGQTLRLRNQGGPGWKGGDRGDALIKITVAAHSFFARDGQDLRLELPVTLAEAVLGGRVSVPTPGGSVQMSIPAGSDTGAKLRLRGRGVPTHGGTPAGDLYASLRVQIGKPDAALEQFLRDWKQANPSDPRRDMEQAQ